MRCSGALWWLAARQARSALAFARSIAGGFDAKLAKSK
jgi:hypothetical protein